MLKATGIVRKVDDLGRVVIPIELRRTLGVDIKDSIEIFTNGDSIVLKKYAPGCVLCTNIENVEPGPGGKLICKSCISQIKSI
ncbi:AbrB/MazE/SpoVT family DNA-binding domain-containing protein [Paenibacillus sp. 2RAB27]|uniref:AbrB/MazE/SpoVT family DNA-binding domain-containing protein n=1 Tax=Paenibacillus sp. 2RAB27 TaxID=3232991 RepID=UPI003F98E8F9